MRAPTLPLLVRLIVPGLGGLLAAASLLLPAATPLLEPVEAIRHAPLSLASGLAQNVVADTAGIRLGDASGFSARLYGPERRFGLFISEIVSAASPFDRLAVRVDAVQPDEAGVELEVRVSADADSWTSWLPLPLEATGLALPGAARYLQYRLTLTAPEGVPGPSVRAVELDLLSSGVATALASVAEQRPTVRLFATREGLVGYRTANGHVIKERDRFVALPSKRALNPAGGRDYQVQLSYKGRTATVPVWDVGPWNTKDNFWDAQRDMWGDLPRFMPQVKAAFFNDYNGGRDERGRWITFPASIDIADGTFWDELGMTSSDWVDVTFLWVNAPSPAPFPFPETIRPKPAPTQQEVVQQPIQAPSQAESVGHRWFLADGSTRDPFETWIHLQNPGDQPSSVELTFTKLGGGSHSQQLRVEPRRRASLFVNQVLPDAEFAVRVDAERPVLVERSIYVGHDGYATQAAAAPATVWYLPEGSTQGGFDTRIHIQNPNEQPVTAAIHLRPESGPEVVRDLLVPALSRASFRVSDVLPNSAFATRVTASAPVVVERTMYLSPGGGVSGTLGAPAPAHDWFFAEGTTIGGHDTWLLLQNPNGSHATARVRYMLEGGHPVDRVYGVGPYQRLSIYVNSVLDPARFGMLVSADLPIVAERSIYFGEGPDGRPSGAHTALGSVRPARAWYLTDGATASPFQEYVLVANPNTQGTSVSVDLMKDDGSVVGKNYSVPAYGRLTVDVASIAPNAAVSARVSANLSVVVERTMYLYDGLGGSTALGIARDP